MVFGFFKRKKKQPPAPLDPLATYDAVMESLERQAAQVRRSAATLLALRGELTRDLEKYERRADDAKKRLGDALAQSDPRAQKTLARDELEAQSLLQATREALARAAEDAKLLLSAAESLGAELAELKAERQSARVRVTAGVQVTQSLKDRVAEVDRVLKLDAARDEVERAHALADIYREDVRAR